MSEYEPLSQDLSQTIPPDALTQALDGFSQRLTQKPSKVLRQLPSKWIPENFLIPEPRDPITGSWYFEPGPIIITEFQGRLVDAALATRFVDGTAQELFKYTTLILSTIKKSGKSTLAAASGLYVLEHTPYGEGYCLANDGSQGSDVLYGPIKRCIELHNIHGGLYKKVKAYGNSIKLPNHAEMGWLPCDAAGNAGKEPTVTLWSEIWGFETPVKRKLFSEMTVPPTRFGRSVRIIDTYAGYSGTSLLLWDLYQQAVKEGQPHPDFLDVKSRGEYVVWENPAAGIFCYWDHEPRMAWQMGSEGNLYYQQEARILEPLEFKRLHNNDWISPIGSFIQPEQWDACKDTTIPPLDERTPLVVCIDAAETNDCAAIFGISRHHDLPDTDVSVRVGKIFKPEGPTGTILLEPTVGRTLLQWGLTYNIMVVVYDAYQLAKLTQDYRRGSLTFTPDELLELLNGWGEQGLNLEQALAKYQAAVQRWYYKYSQQTERAVADKFLWDLIVHRRIHWNPNDQDNDIAPRGDVETLTKHIKQAGADGSGGKYRLEKLSNTLKIDGAVAVAMGSEMCLRLNISDPVAGLAERAAAGEMTYEEYMRLLRERTVISNG